MGRSEPPRRVSSSTVPFWQAGSPRPIDPLWGFGHEPRPGTQRLRAQTVLVRGNCRICARRDVRFDSVARPRRPAMHASHAPRDMNRSAWSPQYGTLRNMELSAADGGGIERWFDTGDGACRPQNYPRCRPQSYPRYG